MKHRRLVPMLFALLFSVSGSVPAHGEEATPTPRPKVKRKLGGGSFGQPPATTPTPSPQGGGSLADVVRKTQDGSRSPGETRPRGIVITNESLQKPQRLGAGPGAASIAITGNAGSKPTVTLRPTPTVPAPIVPEYKDASGRTEADWKARASSVRERAERAEADVVSAESEVRRLENDFYAWSDSTYRERVIRPAWDQAKEKLGLLQAEVEKARAEMTNLEEDARKSGAPPGWLR